MAPRPRPVAERFWEKADRSGGPDACWPWAATKTAGGYGWFRSDRTACAHRVAYELTHGPIPNGLDIDHACHNEAAHRGECAGGDSCPHRLCVNPGHHDLTTERANLLGSPLTLAALNMAKTHCIWGHEFTPANTYHRPSGGRSCRACKALWARRHGKAA